MTKLIDRVYNGLRWRVKRYQNDPSRKAANLRKKTKVDFGSLRKTSPVSAIWGFDRGKPVDRYFIEKFLSKYSGDIKGTVLEIQNNRYTVKFGGDKVSCSETVDNEPSNSTTYNADLRDENALPQDKYDCIIFTQTLQLIDDTDKVIKNLYALLKKDGVLLCTVPTASKIAIEENCDYWRFTKAGARYLFEKTFTKESLDVEAYGNVLANVCFLEGITFEEVNQEELDYIDVDYPLVVSVRARK